MASSSVRIPRIELTKERLRRVSESVEQPDGRAFMEEVVEFSISKFQSDGYGRAFLHLLADVFEQRITTHFSVSQLKTDWLRSLVGEIESRTSKGNRFMTGQLLRAMMVDAHRMGNYPDTELFQWVDRNIEALAKPSAHYIGKTMMRALMADGTPDFELLVQEYTVKGKTVQMTTSIYFDTDSKFVRNLLMDSIAHSIFGKRGHHGLSRTHTTKEFTESLGFTPTSLADFTVETFSRQLEYFYKLSDSNGRQETLRLLSYTYLRIIDLLPENQEQFSYATGLTRSALTMPGFHALWKEGYRVVVHEPTDSPPTFTKWLLYPSKEELSRTNILPQPRKVDVGYKEPILQKLLVNWLWSECCCVKTTRDNSASLKELLDAFVKDEDSGLMTITGAGITAWLASLNGRMGDHSVAVHKSVARQIISYGEESGMINVDASAKMLLSIRSRCRTKRETKCADLEGLRKLAAELADRSTQSVVDDLVYAAFVTISLTGIRVGDVLSLRLDDFVDDNINHIHSVRISTKTDGSDVREMQLPSKVYSLLMGLVEATEEIRRNASPELADYLFLYEGFGYGKTMRLSTCTFTGKIGEACSDLGIEKIRSSDVRRRFENDVITKAIEHSINLLSVRPITGHASIATTQRYYIKDDIRQYCEAAYGIEIGIPKIRGEIVRGIGEASLEERAESCIVEGGAGYCRNETCNIQGTTSCLMCQGFVTTPECIHEMEEALAIIQGKLRDSVSCQHDRSHLLAVKKLYLGYLAVMYTMREDGNE